MEDEVLWEFGDDSLDVIPCEPQQSSGFTAACACSFDNLKTETV
jgi:hypothetical protein